MQYKNSNSFQCLYHTTTKNISEIRRNSKRNILLKYLNEVHTMMLTTDIKTYKGEPFILSNNFDKNIIIFSCQSQTNIDILSKSETIYYLDKTLYVYLWKIIYPKLFTQLFTYMNILIIIRYVPFVFTLLSEQTNIHTFFFLYLLAYECENVALISIWIDSCHITKVWNIVNIFECRFHFTKSWYRKIQNLGLCNAYKNNKTSEGQWLNNIFKS